MPKIWNSTNPNFQNGSEILSKNFETIQQLKTIEIPSEGNQFVPNSHNDYYGAATFPEYKVFLSEEIIIWISFF